jgi:hypothetical protein
MKLLEPRATRTGVVKIEWDPISTLHAELDARYARVMQMRKLIGFSEDNEFYVAVKGECHGLAVAISALRCEPIEEVAARAHDRYLGFLQHTA